VAGQELKGKFRRTPINPIVIWERNNGRKEIITGRHRFDLAKRSGEKTIPAQIVREADGFTRDHAMVLDAEANIMDEKGSIRDFATYFRNTRITEAEARERGLLSRAAQRNAFHLASGAEEDLYSAWRNGRIGVERAAAIAEAAPGDAALQVAAIGKAKDMSPEELKSFVRLMVQNKGQSKASQGDLFGFDDSAIQEMEALSKAASAIQQEMRDRVSAVKGAVRRPSEAKEMGLEGDMDSIKGEKEKLEKDLLRWEKWHTDPELMDQVRQRAGLAVKPRTKPEADTETADAPQKGLFNKKGTPDQKNIFSDTGIPDELDGPPIFSISSRRKKRGKPISREDVAKVFPGSKITPLPHGWRVEVAGSYIDIQKVEEIPVDWDRYEKRIGRRFTPKMRQKLMAPGVFSIRLPDGKEHDGFGLIRIVEGFSDEADLRHEALHLAKRAGLFTEQEWKALADKYAPNETNANMQEELVAQSKDAWETETSVWERIKSWIRRLLAKFGITEAQAKDIHNLMDEAGFWQRQGTKPKDSAYSLSKDMKVGPYLPGASTKLIEEVQARVFIFLDDPNYMEDNPDATPEQLVKWALEDIEAMGDDYGGHSAFATKPQRAEWKKIRREAIKRLESGGDEVYSLIPRDDQPKWYLKSRDLINEKMADRATPHQVLAMLQKNGVKDEELEWTGLRELLGGNSLKTVTKAEVLQALEGVQVEEVEKGGLSGDWVVFNGSENEYFETREEAAAYAKEIGAPSEDMFFEEKKGRDSTKYSNYQLPGGKNYRELLLTLPHDPKKHEAALKAYEKMLGDLGEKYGEPNAVRIGSLSRGTYDKLTGEEMDALKEAETKFRSDKGYRTGHWDEPNVLAHIRFNERTDADGKKVLFIEEIQSDWHQEGRKKGYRGDHNLSGRYLIYSPDEKIVGSTNSMSEAKARANEINGSWGDTENMRASEVDELRAGAVPDAPFKKTWPLLAMKRAIQWGAENGFDRIAWTTGEQQAERYDLSKQVDAIRYKKVGDVFQVEVDSGTSRGLVDGPWDKGAISLPQVEEYFGKEIAERMNSEAGEDGIRGMKELRGDGLRVGGDGMKAFYDQMLPNEVNKFIKKYGAKVAPVGIGTPQKTKDWYATARPNGVFDVYDENKDFIQPIAASSSREAIERVANVMSTGDHRKPVIGVQGFDITSSMRESALEKGQPMYSLIGRPELANPGETKPVRDLVDQVDEERKQAGIPETRSDEQVQQEASQRLEADYAGERAKLLSAARAREMLDDTSTVVAKAIVNKEGEAALQSGDEQARRDAMHLIDAYRRTGTEQGRAFRQRRDPIETPAERMRRMIVEAILTPPQKLGKRIEAARAKGDDALIKALEDQWLRKYEALKAKLKELGVDLDNLNELGYNKVKAAQTLSIIQAEKHDNWDRAYEYWRNAILSSPKTQFANLAGNFGHAAWHYTAERLVEAGANVFIGDAKGAQLGEFKHIIAGILPGLSRAAQNFMLSFKTEMPQFDEQLGREGQFKFESADVAIPGKLGKRIRLPQRLLLASDDFAKTLFAHMEVGARAYRLAKEAGLSGQEMQERIASLSADIDSAAWDLAYDAALDLTFQQKGGTANQAVKRSVLMGRRDLPGARYIVPFVTTPANIFATALKKSPAGSISLAHHMYQNYRDGKHVLDGQSAAVAQQILAWAAVLALLSNDEEDPWITGAEAEFSADKRNIARRTHPVQSVKIGGRWHSYARFEPFATALSVAVDWTNSIKSGNTSRAVSTPFLSIIGQLKNKTWLSGIGDILEALETSKIEEGAIPKWAANFAVSWVPNIARTAGRATEGEFDQTAVWGDGIEWWKMLGKRVVQKTEVVPSAVTGEQPIYDLWGRKAPTSTSPIPSTDWLYRFTVPSDSKLENIHVGDRVLLNYNLQNPDDAKYPEGISYKVKAGEESVYLSDKEYSWLLENGGKIASKLVEEEDWNTDKPTEEDIERLRELISDGRSIAREKLKKAIESGTPPKIGDMDQEIRTYRIEKAITASKKLLEARPTKLTSREEEKGITLAQKRAEWQADREEARRQIESNPLGREAILKGYREWLKAEVKDPDTQYEKLVKFRSQMGWKGLKR
jgi:hypothetical protein